MVAATMTSGTDCKRVLILDINSGGHHPTYVRWLLESSLPSSTRWVLAARPEMFAHPEILASTGSFERYPIDIAPKFEARLGDFSTVSLARMSWSIGRLYREVFKSLVGRDRIDFVIVPFLDDCLLGLAQPDEAFGGVPWLAITMRTMFHYAEVGIDAPPQRFTAVRRHLLRRMVAQRSLSALLTIDPTLASFAESRSSEFHGKIRHLPDPSTFHPVLPTRRDARALLGLPANEPVIVLYGEISDRKGVTALLEAAADSSCSTRLNVMLAGRCKERKRLMKSPAFESLQSAGRLHSIDRYVGGDEEGGLLAAADCFWLGYTGFYGMSGIMVLAGRHGVPVLASQEGLIGYLAKSHLLGPLIDPTDHASVVAALNSLSNDVKGLRAAGRNGAKLFAGHDPIEFQRIVTEQISNALAVGKDRTSVSHRRHLHVTGQ